MKRSFVESLCAGAAAAALFASPDLSAADFVALAGDGVPPSIFFVNPPDGTEDLHPQTPLMFLFSEEMAQTQSIAWSSNVDPTRFIYSWMNEGMMLMVTYPPGFPSDATITWTLNPTAGQAGNFRSAEGEELPAGIYQGSFTTAAGGDPNDPCDPGTDTGMGFGSIGKLVNYVQVGNAAPVLDPEQSALIVASFRASTNHNVTDVNITGPANLTLTNLFGSFNAFREYASIAALDTAFPSGTYTFNATGAGSGTVALGNVAPVPVPKINNLPALVAMDVTKDFTLNFAPFSGAGGANDYISIQISGDTGAGEFYAPDLCVPRELPNTATSVVIPANTFKAGETYQGSITFGRGAYNTNAITATGLSATAANTTSFEFTIGGGTEPNAPMWTIITRNVDGSITYTITGDTGANIAIEATETITDDWTQLTTAQLTTGAFQFTINPNTPNKRFYRARVM